MKRTIDLDQAGERKKRKYIHDETYSGQGELTLDREDYTVGWICALPIELAAARVMRDEEHSPISAAEGDTNSYVLGRIACHGVVMACLPAVGTNAAATAAANMTRSFPRLRFILLVGVGAGAPDPHHVDSETDIRLGDVVVSKPDVKTGGVIQYDFGKTLQSEAFEDGKALNKPPPILRTAVARLEALHITEGSTIDDIIQMTYQSYPRIKKKLRRPDTDDVLFQNDYEHVKGQQDCRSCRPERVVSRQPRDNPAPIIHYGLIASANQVMRDALTRERIRRKLGVICFEMEAAGMMDDCPCLVVRGICDYADSHKNKQWQPYAALTAAAYAKELLSSIEASSMRSESVVKLIDVLQEQVAVSQEHLDVTRENHEKQDVRYQNDKHQACHRVFDVSEYERWKNINIDAVKGTCCWVLNHPRYREWWSSMKDDLLWITADPGCGKSVLSKSLIDHWLRPTAMITSGDTSDLIETQATTNVPSQPHTVCYYFFKDNEEQSGLATALCALLHQLFRQQPDLICHALPAFQEHREGELPKNVNELWRILFSVARDTSARPITCVLDALDECRDGDRQQLIDLLCQLHESFASEMRPHSWMKWIVTSRPHGDIQEYFRRLPAAIPSIHLRGEDENDQIRKEIDLVIEARVLELRARHNLSEKKAGELTQSLRGMANRTYLWLHLVIDDLDMAFRAELITEEARISSLPPTVDAAYDKILGRIANGAAKQHARNILTIIVGARRPLTLGEMALALGTIISSNIPRSLADLNINAMGLADKIRDLCGLFVFVNHNRLYLLHQTAKEFLLNQVDQLAPSCPSWKHCLPLLEVEKMLAIICIRFLCLSDFNDRQGNERSHGEGQSNAMSSIQPFFDFAAEHWASHTRPIEGRLDKETWTSVQALYNTRSERWIRWTSAMWQGTKYRYSDFSMNHIQLAAFNGHNLLLQTLLQISPQEADLRDHQHATGLIWASERGFSEVVQTLLDAGADVNAQGGFYGSALQVASDRGHGKVVQLLLDAGADVNAQGGFYGSALQAASDHGHGKVVQLLLAAGADVNVQEGPYGSVLQAASDRGHDKVVQLLLDAGADVNTQGGPYGSVLQAASDRGHDKVVQLLLGAGADVNVHGGYGSALQVASDRGHGKVVQLLLDAGADVNAQGGFYGSALQAASDRGHGKVVQLLLDAGADVNVQGGFYGDVLQHTA